MDHTEAVETLAPERYLLNEMTVEDREAFEDHYFDCAECAADLRSGTALVAGIRTAQPKPHSQPSMIWSWTSTAAAAVLAIVVGYQRFAEIPQLQAERDRALQPGVFRELALSTGMSRGEEANVVSAGVPLALKVDIVPEPGATGYVLEIVDAKGVTRARDHVSAAEANDSVHIRPAGGRLPPGRYSLKVKPEGAGQPSSVLFDVR